MKQFSLAEKASWSISDAIFRAECANKMIKEGLLGAAMGDLYEAQGLLSDALHFVNKAVEREVENGQE